MVFFPNFKKYLKNKKKYTLMIVPNNQHGIKNFYFNHLTVLILLFLTITLILFSILLIAQTTVKSKQLSRFGEILYSQSRKIKNYNQQLDLFAHSLDSLVHAITSYHNVLPAVGNVYGIGGEEVSLENINKIINDYKILTNEREKSAKKDYLNISKKYLKISYQFSRSIRTFIQKRNDFFAHMPTMWPVLHGLGEGILLKEKKKPYLLISYSSPFQLISPGDGVVNQLEKKENETYKIIVDHGYGFFSEFSNIFKTDVVVGDKLKKGDIIAYVSDEVIYRFKDFINLYFPFRLCCD